MAAGKPPVILAIHSFTQAWKSVPRPWHVAVLWDKDPRLACALLRELAAIPGITVGDNVPYSGQLKGDTLYQHGTLRGLAHALIEVRQDLILGPEGQEEWGERLASVVRHGARCRRSRTQAPRHRALRLPYRRPGAGLWISWIRITRALPCDSPAA